MAWCLIDHRDTFTFTTGLTICCNTDRECNHVPDEERVLLFVRGIYFCWLFKDAINIETIQSGNDIEGEKMKTKDHNQGIRCPIRDSNYRLPNTSL
jgi:hypothetical protein